MSPSPKQMARIQSAWSQAMPPLAVAAELRLVPLTVIREYVRLDCFNTTNPVPLFQPERELSH